MVLLTFIVVLSRFVDISNCMFSVTARIDPTDTSRTCGSANMGRQPHATAGSGAYGFEGEHPRTAEMFNKPAQVGDNSMSPERRETTKIDSDTTKTLCFMCEAPTNERSDLIVFADACFWPNYVCFFTVLAQMFLEDFLEPQTTRCADQFYVLLLWFLHRCHGSFRSKRRNRTCSRC